MGLHRFSFSFFGLLLLLSFRAHCHNSSTTNITFLQTPLRISSSSRATFVFQVFQGRDTCTNCSIKCKLDGQISSDCASQRASFVELHEGEHTFEVCINGFPGAGCANYNWTVDTVPPTAYVTAKRAFTNELNISVDISFTEVCSSGGGFGCNSVNSCNLLVYGHGQVMPSTLKVIQPGLRFSLLVGLSSSVQYGRVILVMDKNFCTDGAGNSFSRTANSSAIVRFDRRSVFVNLRTHVPEKLLQLSGETRTVEATNSRKNLKVYLYFSEPVLNSSVEVLRSLQTSEGLLLPNNRKTIGNRRFGFLVKNIPNMSIVTINFASSSIISRQGTPVSPIAPVTFLYDSVRPSVSLSTTSNMRTREKSVQITIKFVKPVFGFNSSTLLLSGCHLQSFHEISRSIYIVEIRAHDAIVSVNVPENITKDVAGNTNLASNILQVRHYSVPVVASVFSTFTNTAFALTSLASGLLTISTASLQSFGVLSRRASLPVDPARNLFRFACHIQIFALSRWLSVNLPVEYYEFSRGLEWSIPYLSIPWETGSTLSMVNTSPSSVTSSYNKKESVTIGREQLGDGLEIGKSLFGLPLTPMEYRSFFESHNIKPEAEYILDKRNLNGWEEFARNMFWLGVVGGSFILLHAMLLLILRCRRKNSEEHHSNGALILPRFEIFLIILALPCICQASTTLLKGGRISGVIVGILLLAVTSFLLLALFMFLSVGITFGKLLQYKEIHQEGQKFYWYQDIVRVTLGPGKRGQWTWKNEQNSDLLTMLGPLFEDLRGPPKYMLSQIAGGSNHKHSSRIIASDDETEDAEAPLIQKVFGILRIYYTLLDSMKRVILGVMAGVYKDNGSSRTPVSVLLCLTSVQLFFLVLKKPFIKKKVQLVEILSVTSEVGIFATCLVISEKKFSVGEETTIGICMLLSFLIAFIAQMINAWYALYRQTIRLDSTEKHLLPGLKKVLFGFLLILIPWNLLKKLNSEFLSNHSGSRNSGETTSGGQYRSSGSRSSGTTDKPWLKQLRELAKDSFSKEETRTQHDPSTSSQTQKSGFWGRNWSNSSSVASSIDLKSKSKSKSKTLYRDLESIFSSK